MPTRKFEPHYLSKLYEPGLDHGTASEASSQYAQFDPAELEAVLQKFKGPQLVAVFVSDIAAGGMKKIELDEEIYLLISEKTYQALVDQVNRMTTGLTFPAHENTLPAGALGLYMGVPIYPETQLRDFMVRKIRAAEKQYRYLFGMDVSGFDK